MSDKETLADILVGCAQLLDTIKGEWGGSWSQWDQSIRDGISSQLKIIYAAQYVPKPLSEEGIMKHETLCICGHCETRRWVEHQDEARENQIADAKADWKLALNEYGQVREEIGRLEETGECTCDPNDFHTCSLCNETAALDRSAVNLMRQWGDTWAMKLASQLNEPWHETQERLTDRS